MTKSIEYNAATGNYDLIVEIDGAVHHIGDAPTQGAGDVKCNLFLIAYFEDACTPELAAELILANQFAGYV